MHSSSGRPRPGALLARRARMMRVAAIPALPARAVHSRAPIQGDAHA